MSSSTALLPPIEQRVNAEAAELPWNYSYESTRDHAWNLGLASYIVFLVCLICFFVEPLKNNTARDHDLKHYLTYANRRRFVWLGVASLAHTYLLATSATDCHFFIPISYVLFFFFGYISVVATMMRHLSYAILDRIRALQSAKNQNEKSAVFHLKLSGYDKFKWYDFMFLAVSILLFAAAVIVAISHDLDKNRVVVGDTGYPDTYPKNTDDEVFALCYGSLCAVLVWNIVTQIVNYMTASKNDKTFHDDAVSDISYSFQFWLIVSSLIRIGVFLWAAIDPIHSNFEGSFTWVSLAEIIFLCITILWFKLATWWDMEHHTAHTEL